MKKFSGKVKTTGNILQLLSYVSTVELKAPLDCVLCYPEGPTQLTFDDSYCEFRYRAMMSRKI